MLCCLKSGIFILHSNSELKTLPVSKVYLKKVGERFLQRQWMVMVSLESYM